MNNAFNLKFSIVFKFFDFFCHSLCLTIFTGQRNFLNVVDGLQNTTPESKICFEHFIALFFGNVL